MLKTILSLLASAGSKNRTHLNLVCSLPAARRLRWVVRRSRWLWPGRGRSVAMPGPWRVRRTARRPWQRWSSSPGYDCPGRRVKTSTGHGWDCSWGRPSDDWGVSTSEHDDRDGRRSADRRDAFRRQVALNTRALYRAQLALILSSSLHGCVVEQTAV